MKRYTLLTATVLLATTVLTAACDKGLADINENPNAPTDVPAQYLLPEVTRSTVEQIYYNWFTLDFTGAFAQHFAKIQYVEEDQYELRPATIDGFWANMYAADQKDWQTIIEKGQETGFVNHEATALVMKSYLYQVMTDIWGDIPYSEALKGDAEEPNTTPVYDSQEAIYNGMVADLDRAMGLFDASGRTFGGEDLIYGGDVADWARFANSLKLRMALRVSGVAAGTGQQWAQEAAGAAAGLITSNDQNAQLNFLDASPHRNPMFENAIGRDDHSASATLVNLMVSLNDPRLQVYADPVAQPDNTIPDGHQIFGAEYRGQPNGVLEENVYPLPSVSRIGSWWRDTGDSQNATRPAWLMTAAEVHFLLAEAALNNWSVPGTAQGHYEAGVRAAFDQYDNARGIDLGTAVQDAYLAGAAAWPATEAEQREAIGTQKWLALYTISWEAYSEFRRTGYPTSLQINPGHAVDHVPGRIPYPDTEQSLNRDNWMSAINAQGLNATDTYQGKTWWEPTLDDNGS